MQIKGLGLAFILLGVRVAVAQSNITLPVDYWDFLYSGTSPGTYGGYSGTGHPDFQQYVAGLATGLVQSTLGSNGRPVFASSKGSGMSASITSAASFSQWYQTVPGVNVYAPGALILTNIGNDTYQYASRAFFPLDGQAFNSTAFQMDHDCDDEVLHNFSFTTHIQFTGQFNNSQSINIVGDDDIWVFINGQLVIDMGGVHGATAGNWTGDAPSLARLGISPNQTVTVDIFHAQRHTCASDFTLTTNIANLTPTLQPAISLTTTAPNLVLTFAGVLQQSSDLVNWQDVTPQPASPWSFSPSGTMFFKARR